MSVIRVQLAGGLGNNLFQLSAGIAHANKFGKDLLVLRPKNLEKKYSHTFDSNLLGNFNLAHNDTSASLGISRFAQRIENRALKSISFISKFRGIDIPNEVGFSESVLNDKDLVELRGYYQSYRYSEYTENSLGNYLELKYQTDWFRQATEEIQLNSELACIHIRFGDYKNLKSNFGLLSSEYYLNAIEKMNSQLHIKKYWVFTDDLEYARFLLKDIRSNFFFVDPSEHSSPSESLILMSKFKAHIIGNSTYSWWGSYLSKVSRMTIYPDPWFKNLGLIRDLVPPDWISEKSYWR